MTATIKIDQGVLRRLERRMKITERDTRRAISAAVNDTLKKAKVKASQEIRKKIALKKQFVDKRLNIRRASPRREQISGILYVSSKPVSLSHFNPIQRKEGVAVRINKGSRTSMSRAFGPKRPRLKGGVYVRQSVAASSSGPIAFRAKRFVPRTSTGRRGGTLSYEPIITVPGVVFSEEAIAVGAVATVRAFRGPELRKNIQRRMRLVRLRAAGKVPPAPGS